MAILNLWLNRNECFRVSKKVKLKSLMDPHQLKGRAGKFAFFIVHQNTCTNVSPLELAKIE